MCYERDANGRLHQMGFRLRRTWIPQQLMTGHSSDEFLRWSRIGELCLKREHVYRDIYREYLAGRDDHFVGLISP